MWFEYILKNLDLNSLKISRVRSLVFFLLIALGANAQTIINAESVNDDKDSSIYSLSLSYSGTRGNSNTNQLSVSPVIILTGKRNELKLLAAYDVLSSGENNILNGGYVHARHNYKLKPFLKTVAFYQLQFNEVLKLNKREVFGSGLKFELIRKDSLALSVSMGLMHELEVLNRNNLTLYEKYKTNYVRGSFITSFKWIIDKNWQINNVVYYQPWLQKFGDYRMLNDLNLSVKITDKFKFLLISSFRLDSEPPSSIGGYDWNFSVGLNVKL